MHTPGERNTIQAGILEYAEQQRGFDLDVPRADRAKNRSLYFDDLLDAKVWELNPRYAEVEDVGEPWQWEPVVRQYCSTNSSTC